MKTKLEIKRQARNKPGFTRQQSSYRKFRDAKWRYPRGKSSKVRLKISGHKIAPSIGYGSSNDERYLNRYGLQEVLVRTEKDLVHLHATKHAVILAGSLGLKKKLILLEKIKASNLHVMNVHDGNEFIKSMHEMLEKKKEEKKGVKKKEAKKPEVKEKPLEKVSSKVEEKKEPTQEEKEKLEKEEQRKVLERKV